MVTILIRNYLHIIGNGSFQKEKKNKSSAFFWWSCLIISFMMYIYSCQIYQSQSYMHFFFHMASSFFFLEFKVVISINNKWSSWFWQLGYFICHVRKFVFTLAHLSKPTEQYEVNNHLLPYLQHWSSYQNEIWVDRCLARIAPYLVLCSSTCVDYW